LRDAKIKRFVLRILETIFKYVRKGNYNFSAYFKLLLQNFYRVLSGQEVKSPRWQVCTNDATFLMQLASGALYVDNHFSNTDKEEVTRPEGMN